MHQPLISIVTPAHDFAPFLHACIESVLARAHEPFEQLGMEPPLRARVKSLFGRC